MSGNVGEQDVPAVISLANISERFGAVQALNDVSLELRRGEVHVLLGENGAGKSTLVNIVIGALAPDSGSIRVRGVPVAHHSPAYARQQGINTVLQDFSLAPDLSVADNLFLGREMTRFGLRLPRRMKEEATRSLQQLGVKIASDRPVGTLSRAEQQIVEIVKALRGKPGALLLDEPTASLTEEETERLFTIVRRLRSEGWGMLYITHRLEEVRRLGDRVTILRDGRHVATYDLSEVSDSRLIQDMIGRPLSAIYPDKSTELGEPVFRLSGVTTVNRHVIDASLTVRAGEIVGLAGLVGSGKSEVARACFGLLPITAGWVEVGGRRVERPDPRTMLELRIVYLPQDRRGEALALGRSVKENVVLEVLARAPYSKLGMVRDGVIAKMVGEIIARLNLRPPGLDRPVERLSGGNQQKVVLGRALTRSRNVYIFDEPTVGIDIGTRQELYGHMRSLCEAGAGVLMVSSDLEEIVHLADRVYVMHRGRVQGELEGNGLTPEAVVSHSFGHAAAEVAGGH